MVKKWITFVSIAVFLLVLLGIFNQKPHMQQTSKPDTILQSEIYEIPNGYGYRLWSKNRLLVQQEVIPAVSGIRPFASFGDAQKVADLVIHKMELGEDPRVRKEELEQLHINIPNFDHWLNNYATPQ